MCGVFGLLSFYAELKERRLNSVCGLCCHPCGYPLRNLSTLVLVFIQGRMVSGVSLGGCVLVV